jgi:histidinol-phosphatase (PHP family)
LAPNESPLATADNHVHTEWSWDATAGDMDGTCHKALDLGLKSVASTEHADFVQAPDGKFDAEGYLECVARCRAKYPDLRILTGVELGEPHKYPEETRALLDAGFDRVLASVHGVTWEGRFTDACEPGFFDEDNLDEYLQLYFGETAALIASDVQFEVLAHIDYPKRYLPEGLAYSPETYEVQFRAILKAAAKRGVVLEVNTTRGRKLCPGLTELKWWREEGGRAVSFGSDAHRPEFLADGFAHACEVAAAAGFRPTDDPNGFWTR